VGKETNSISPDGENLTDRLGEAFKLHLGEGEMTVRKKEKLA